MPNSRRQFLGAIALAGACPFGALASAPRLYPGGIPPHRGEILPGVHAYADRANVRPGDMIRFHASHTVPCRVGMVRVGDAGAPDRDMADLGPCMVGATPIYAGSYIHVPHNVPEHLGALSIEALVRAGRVDRLVGVVTQEEKESDAGFALGIGNNIIPRKSQKSRNRR